MAVFFPGEKKKKRSPAPFKAKGQGKDSVLQEKYRLFSLHVCSFKHLNVGKKVLIGKIFGLLWTSFNACLTFDTDAGYISYIGNVDTSHRTFLNTDTTVITFLLVGKGLCF